MSLRFQTLSLLEKYSYTPKQWDNIDRQTQVEMIAKHQLEIERDKRIHEKNKAD